MAHAPASGHLQLARSDEGEVTLAPAAHPPGPPPRQRQLGLSWLDTLPLRSMVSDEDPRSLVEEVRASAEALSGDDRDGARLRMLARMIATTRAHVAVLEAMLAERLAKRDREGVELVERVINNATRRLTLLLSEHRQGSSTRVVVAVGGADAIVVRGEE